MQRIVGNSEEIAEKIVSAGMFETFRSGEALVEQNDATNDIYFLVAGSVSIQINRREVNTRLPGQHVGEMAAIDVHALRSASVIATADTAAIKVTEPDFSDIANVHATIWRELATELGERLRQRGSNVLPRNDIPKMFVGSSAEALSVARCIQDGLKYDRISVKVWTDGVFRASSTTVGDLQNEIRTTDFGVLVFTPDDKIESRSDTKPGPRDNVVFELGLFMGALGRERAFIVKPRGMDLKIPSDLLGMNPIDYSVDPAIDLNNRS
jgi:CRP/FNR family cyclic AMP-dependent transcriptional regulator